MFANKENMSTFATFKPYESDARLSIYNEGYFCIATRKKSITVPVPLCVSCNGAQNSLVWFEQQERRVLFVYIKMFKNTNLNVQTFNNSQFGDLRVNLSNDGKIWFCLSDVCVSLGLGNASQTKSRLKQEGITTNDTPTRSGQQQMLFIDEPNLYRCIFQSRKKEAEKFQDWVCDEVLPSLRQTGSYSVGKPLSPMEMQLEMMKSMQLQLQELIDTKEEVKQLKSELADVRQRTLTELEASTIVAYVTRNHIKLDVTKYGAMGRKATSLCKKRGIEVAKINDVRWGMVSVYPDSVLKEVFYGRE